MLIHTYAFIQMSSRCLFHIPSRVEYQDLKWAPVPISGLLPLVDQLCEMKGRGYFLSVSLGFFSPVYLPAGMPKHLRELMLLGFIFTTVFFLTFSLYIICELATFIPSFCSWRWVSIKQVEGTWPEIAGREGSTRKQPVQFNS